jgi:HD-GYP domain-containing protein (c-di-GMP phosphodiesterase class II)
MKVKLDKVNAHLLAKTNSEFWLILSLFVLAGILNFLVSSHKMVLGLYSLPTLFSAYTYGRRHAVLTAFASIFIVGMVVYWSPQLSKTGPSIFSIDEQWFDITVWGGILAVTAYGMGTLHQKQQEQMEELKSTYDGVLMILQQFITKDKYTQNHSYRVSVYACKIGACYGLSQSRIDDIRAAALLHDIGKLDISRDILYKAARLTKEEFEEMKQHVEKGMDILEPVGGTLRRVLPIILSHHDKFDGSGYHPTKGEEIPLEARIISVADVYDSLTSDRPYRKAMSTFDAKEIIEKGSGIDFDPRVVTAFQVAFRRHELEVPEVVV